MQYIERSMIGTCPKNTLGKASSSESSSPSTSTVRVVRVRSMYSGAAYLRVEFGGRAARC